jgi:serine/threonine protein kinase
LSHGKREYRPGAVLAGKYKLQRQLGRGAAGMVWAAVNVTTSRQVALKLLLNPEPKAKERLLREARAAGALKHPNVVDVYDVIVTEDGSPGLVLELLEGQSLQDLITERAPLPPAEAAAIARDVARALTIAHASGIVHRDLKPANIFLHRPSDDPYIVKVVDFGISKNLLAGEGTLTETGMAVGSPSFMSPEQVRGERHIDGRADLWALGVILYEMLSGRRLFDGRAHEVLTNVLVQPFKPVEDLVPGLDPALARVVKSLLQRELDKRASSAEEVAEWLGAIVSAGSRSIRPTEPPPSTSRRAHDTTVIPAKISVPKIHDQDEDDEATHVAPMAMKRMATQQKGVPSVYSDDEDEEDRTRVAADAEITAAVLASRDVDPQDRPTPTNNIVVPPLSDQNAVPTVRPPAPSQEDLLGPRSERGGHSPRSQRQPPLIIGQPTEKAEKAEKEKAAARPETVRPAKPESMRPAKPESMRPAKPEEPEGLQAAENGPTSERSLQKPSETGLSRSLVLIIALVVLGLGVIVYLSRFK